MESNIYCLLSSGSDVPRELVTYDIFQEFILYIITIRPKIPPSLAEYIDHLLVNDQIKMSDLRYALYKAEAVGYQNLLVFYLEYITSRPLNKLMCLENLQLEIQYWSLDILSHWSDAEIITVVGYYYGINREKFILGVPKLSIVLRYVDTVRLAKLFNIDCNKPVDGQLPIVNYFEYRGFNTEYLKWLLYNTDITPSLRETLLVKAKEYVQDYPLTKYFYTKLMVTFIEYKIILSHIKISHRNEIVRNATFAARGAINRKVIQLRWGMVLRIIKVVNQWKEVADLGKPNHNVMFYNMRQNFDKVSFEELKNDFEGLTMENYAFYMDTYIPSDGDSDKSTKYYNMGRSHIGRAITYSEFRKNDLRGTKENYKTYIKGWTDKEVEIADISDVI